MTNICKCTRSLMDRTEASDAFDAGSIPVGCIFFFYGDYMGYEGGGEINRKGRDSFSCRIEKMISRIIFRITGTTI